MFKNLKKELIGGGDKIVTLLILLSIIIIGLYVLEDEIRKQLKLSPRDLPMDVDPSVKIDLKVIKLKGLTIDDKIQLQKARAKSRPSLPLDAEDNMLKDMGPIGFNINAPKNKLEIMQYKTKLDDMIGKTDYTDTTKHPVGIVGSDGILIGPWHIYTSNNYLVFQINKVLIPYNNTTKPIINKLENYQVNLVLHPDKGMLIRSKDNSNLYQRMTTGNPKIDGCFNQTCLAGQYYGNDEIIQNTNPKDVMSTQSDLLLIGTTGWKIYCDDNMNLRIMRFKKTLFMIEPTGGIVYRSVSGIRPPILNKLISTCSNCNDDVNNKKCPLTATIAANIKDPKCKYSMNRDEFFTIANQYEFQTTENGILYIVHINPEKKDISKYKKMISLPYGST